jgi:hypothetical protein
VLADASTAHLSKGADVQPPTQLLLALWQAGRGGSRLAAVMSLGHHLDHLIRHNASNHRS